MSGGRPGGTSFGDVSVAVDDESTAGAARGLIATPLGDAWLPGLVIDTELVIVQSKVRVPVKPAESVAVTVTA